MNSGLNRPLWLGSGSAAAVVGVDVSGVGMVEVVRGGAVVGGAVVEGRGAVVVAGRPGAAVVDDEFGGRVVVVVRGLDVVVVVDDVGMVTWAAAGHIAHTAKAMTAAAAACTRFTRRVLQRARAPGRLWPDQTMTTSPLPSGESCTG